MINMIVSGKNNSIFISLASTLQGLFTQAIYSSISPSGAIFIENSAECGFKLPLQRDTFLTYKIS
jgi:hypothetical protein